MTISSKGATVHVLHSKQKGQEQKRPRNPDRPESLDIRSELFCDVIQRLEKYDLQSVAEESGVSHGCLWTWVFGNTISPRLNNVIAVAEVIGLEVTLTDYEVGRASSSGKKAASG